MIKDLQQFQFVLKNRKDLNCVFSFIALLLLCQKGQAQFVNQGDLKVSNNTLLSIYMDYDNTTTGNFINDGQVHAFKNYNNDGVVSYNEKNSGTTSFVGEQEQVITGSQIADFQNIVFNNLASLIPFQLKTTISIGKNSDFKYGIVNAADYNGKVIFKENATHSEASDQSFVDGKVQKKGTNEFQFPIGDEYFFRPSFQAGAANGDIYTAQYFHKNSADLHSHLSKDETILQINDQEYWEVKQEKGADKIVLSLSLNNDTTPSQFFAETSKVKVAIVRWDEALGKWVNDKGVLSEPVTGEAYSRLLTGAVGGYGIFTTALVKAEFEDHELIVYNAVSPNGDGINDTFHIKGINKYPDNSLEIYNRWGVKVYEAKSYNESDVMFAGYSDGRATINRGEKLPTGTYFYILKYNNTQRVVEKSGYLYINNQ